MFPNAFIPLAALKAAISLIRMHHFDALWEY